MPHVSTVADPTLVAPPNAGRTGKTEAFTITRTSGSVRLAGEFSTEHARPIWRTLRSIVGRVDGEKLDLDVSGVTFVDGAVVALLVELRSGLASRAIRCELTGGDERMRALIRLYQGDRPVEAAAPPKRKEIPLERLGGATERGLRSGAQWISFVGSIASSAVGVVVRPMTANFRSILPLAERAGADGVPIVLLLNFLVGFVMAYQSAHQLERYGANVFVADVVGIAVTRELAPLMTAIIMSGRSGAAFAAELGTMKVSEEIDALRTLGLEPARYLILPRVIALAIVAPALTLLGDVIGVFGGAVVGVLSLDVGMRGYLSELQTAVDWVDVCTGLVKSVVFGITIALIGCQQGFATSGGAAGVGRRTTATVVTCLFAIVLLDTLFTVFFRMLQL